MKVNTEGYGADDVMAFMSKEETATMWFALLEYKTFVEANLLRMYGEATKDVFLTNGTRGMGDQIRITNYGDRKEALEEQADLYESLLKTTRMLAQMSEPVARMGIT
jgi:hypothetical protein